MSARQSPGRNEGAGGGAAIADWTRVSFLGGQVRGYVIDVTCALEPMPLDGDEVAEQRVRIERFIAEPGVPDAGRQAS